ncbi:hypothetical protein [Nocardia sp. NPDC051570]|uniref:hypothetical protein n=1 Tax=Nocardia sp. NPDC051570 TaxID=3364324 RepID=UPI0037928911
MKAAHLTYDHVGRTLVTGTGSKRKRAVILDLDYKDSYIVVKTRTAHGDIRPLVLANGQDIETEQ